MWGREDKGLGGGRGALWGFRWGFAKRLSKMALFLLFFSEGKTFLSLERRCKLIRLGSGGIMFCTGGEGEAERVRAGWKQETPSGVLSAASGSRLKVFTPPFGKKKKNGATTFQSK